MNQRNFGVCEGRLVRNPVFKDNKDGSRKALLTVAARQNFASNGTVGSDFIQLQAYIAAGKNNTAYDIMQQGDLVGFEYTVRSNAYTDDNGVEHYTQALNVQSVDLKETKSQAAARRERAAEAATAAEEAADKAPFDE